MIVIRLARGGKKKAPFYRVVVSDKRSPRDGRYIERLGSYNPVFNNQGDQKIEINLERVDYWLNEGAKVTDRANILIKRHRKETIKNDS